MVSNLSISKMVNIDVVSDTESPHLWLSMKNTLFFLETGCQQSFGIVTPSNCSFRHNVIACIANL